MLRDPRRNHLVYGASDMMPNIGRTSGTIMEPYLDSIGVCAVTIGFIPTLSILLPWIATDSVMEPFFVHGDHVSIG